MVQQLKNLKIGTKLGLGFGVVLVLISIVSTVAYQSIQSLIQSTQWVEHTHKVIRVGESVSAFMVDMETGLRGYLVTGERQYLEPYESGKQSFTQLIQKGAKLTSDNAAQVERWEKVAELEKSWQNQWAIPAIEQRQQIKAGELSQANFKRISARLLGKTLFDGIRKKLNTLDQQVAQDDLVAKHLVTQAVLALVNMETGQRGFLLSGDESSLEPYIQGQKDLQQVMSTLKSQRGMLASYISEVESAVSEWRQRVAEVEIDARRDVNNYPLTLEDLIAEMAKGTGKQYMDSIRTVLNDIVAEEERLIVTRLQDQQSTASFATNFTLFGTLLAIFVSAFFAWLVTRSITRPVTRLQNLVQEISHSGELSRRCDYQSKDEIGQMANAFNELMQNVQSAITQSNRVVSDLAKGKFESRVELTLSGDLLRLKEGINQSAESVDKTLNELERVIEALNQGRFEIDLSTQAQGKFKRMIDELSDSMTGLHKTFQSINQVMSAMQAGQFDQRVSIDAQGDVLTLKEGMNASLTSLENAIADISTVVIALSNGDLTQMIRAQYQGELHQLTLGVNTTIEKLSTVVSQATQATNVVSSASAEVSQGSLDLSERVQQQAAAIEQTSATMEQMTSSVSNNASHAKEASAVAQNVLEQSLAGSEVMGQTIGAMNQIQASSQKISEIVTLIDGIAFQTNLLALNAAVEAARAGDHGRGFAVVAGEVRTLAQKSADAAKDITALINESVERINIGTKLASESGEKLSEINQSVDEVTEMVKQISQASDQQMESIQQVNQAVVQIDEGTQQNAALVEETSAAASSMTHEAATLEKDMAFFKITQVVSTKRGGQSPVASTPQKVQQQTPEKPSATPKSLVSKKVNNQPISAPQKPLSTKKSVASEEQWDEF